MVHYPLPAWAFSAIGSLFLGKVWSWFRNWGLICLLSGGNSRSHSLGNHTIVLRSTCWGLGSSVSGSLLKVKQSLRMDSELLRYKEDSHTALSWGEKGIPPPPFPSPPLFAKYRKPESGMQLSTFLPTSLICWGPGGEWRRQLFGSWQEENTKSTVSESEAQLFSSPERS